MLFGEGEDLVLFPGGSVLQLRDRGHLQAWPWAGICFLVRVRRFESVRTGSDDGTRVRHTDSLARLPASAEADRHGHRHTHKHPEQFPRFP